MAVEGSLDLFQLPEILQIISQEGKTGILTVQGQDDIIAISFLDGRVVAADALNSTLEDGLGEVLLEQNLLTPQGHEEALGEKRRSGRRLMDVLEETGALQRDQLLEALRTLTFDLLEKLLSWRQGEFKFYSGEEVSYEEGFRPITIEDLLLANLPQVAEQARSEAEELAQAEEPGEPEQPEPPQAIGRAGAGEPTEEIGEPGTTHPMTGASEASTERPISLDPPDLGETPLWPTGPRADVPAFPEVRETPVRTPKVARPARRAAKRATGTRSRPVLAWGLGLLAAATLAAVAATAPTALLVLPATSAKQQAAFEDSRREARYTKIESVMRTYALLEGRLPEDLGELVRRGFLPPDEVRGPLGQSLLYETDGLVYRIRPLLTEEETAFLGSLRGDFLLDPSQLEDLRDGSSRPLVLLD